MFARARYSTSTSRAVGPHEVNSPASWPSAMNRLHVRRAGRNRRRRRRTPRRACRSGRPARRRRERTPRRSRRCSCDRRPRPATPSRSSSKTRLRQAAARRRHAREARTYDRPRGRSTWARPISPRVHVEVEWHAPRWRACARFSFVRVVPRCGRPGVALRAAAPELLREQTSTASPSPSSSIVTRRRPRAHPPCRSRRRRAKSSGGRTLPAGSGARLPARCASPSTPCRARRATRPTPSAPSSRSGPNQGGASQRQRRPVGAPVQPAVGRAR